MNWDKYTIIMSSRGTPGNLPVCRTNCGACMYLHTQKDTPTHASKKHPIPTLCREAFSWPCACTELKLHAFPIEDNGNNEIHSFLVLRREERPLCDLQDHALGSSQFSTPISVARVQRLEADASSSLHLVRAGGKSQPHALRPLSFPVQVSSQVGREFSTG